MYSNADSLSLYMPNGVAFPSTKNRVETFVPVSATCTCTPVQQKPGGLGTERGGKRNPFVGVVRSWSYHPPPTLRAGTLQPDGRSFVF